MTNAIQRLIVHHVRNLEAIDMAPHPGLNAFIGDNGQGKTNLLEAISLATCLKPLRTVRTPELITFGHHEGAVTAFLGGSTVQLTIDQKGKKLLLDDKPLRDATKLAERLSVVTFTPDDLNIVFGSASFRRRAINQLTAGLFPAYVRIYRQYEQALLGRNRLLKDISLDLSELRAFTLILANTSNELQHLRKQAIDLWIGPFETTLAGILGPGHTATMQYLPSCFEERLSEERARKTTLSGPHLDELEITLDGVPARQTASRGQARALVLALKMAQMKAIHNKRQISPLFLLDDVVGELDPHNAERLLNVTHELGCQTFLTTTHSEAIPNQWQTAPQFLLRAGKIHGGYF